MIPWRGRGKIARLDGAEWKNRQWDDDLQGVFALLIGSQRQRGFRMPGYNGPWPFIINKQKSNCGSKQNSVHTYFWRQFFFFFFFTKPQGGLPRHFESRPGCLLLRFCILNFQNPKLQPSFKVYLWHFAKNQKSFVCTPRHPSRG